MGFTQNALKSQNYENGLRATQKVALFLPIVEN